MSKRVISYEGFKDKTAITWANVKWAALDPEKSPFTEGEREYLSRYKDNDEEFFERMWQLLNMNKNETEGTI